TLPGRGTIAVTPVRTSSPSIRVTCPTRTPATSVMPLCSPVGRSPGAMPRSRALARSDNGPPTPPEEVPAVSVVPAETSRSRGVFAMSRPLSVLTCRARLFGEHLTGASNGNRDPLPPPPRPSPRPRSSFEDARHGVRQVPAAPHDDGFFTVTPRENWFVLYGFPYPSNETPFAMSASPQSTMATA